MKNIKNVSPWSLVACAFAVIFTVAACSDDDNHTQNDISDSTERYEKLRLDSLRYELLLRQLCDVENLYNATIAYTPRYGEALHAATPTIYYVGVDTLPQARGTWQCITSAVRDSASATAQINEVSILNMHLSYTEGGAGDELARIDVECPELANVLTSIVFIPAKRWSSNDEDSPFGFLSVWKEDSTGFYYLCVQKAQGCNGILLSFDTKIKDAKIKWETEEMYSPKQGNFFLYKNTARGDAFAALANCVNFNSTEYDKAVNKLRGRGSMTLSWLALLSNSWIYSSFSSLIFANDYLRLEYSSSGGYYYAVVNYSRLKKQNGRIICDNYQKTFKECETPDHELPSRAIYFKPDFNNEEGWTCIYKGS
jgi:hypothetical protein